nr:hypothetical protein [Tanacetum cinerariifolium]
MDGWKPRDLKNKSFAEIKELFDKAVTRINNFVDFRTDLVKESSKKAEESSSKRAGDELEHESAKMLMVDDDQEAAELKWCLEIVYNDEDDVTIDDTPLSLRLAKVKNWKLFDSCGVHCVLMQNTTYYLLVEKMYPLTNYTLTQMWNDVRLQVDYKVEMTYDLLRLIKRQLREGYVLE